MPTNRPQYGAVFAYAWVVWAAQVSQQVVFGMYYVLKGDVSLSSLWKTPSQNPSATASEEPDEDVPF